MALSNAQYDAIMRVYGQRQLDNFHRQKEAVKHAYEQLPRLRELDERISSASVAAAQQMIEGDKQASERLKVFIAEISAEKKSLLEQAGLGAGYLDLHYTCPDCRDTGFIDGEKCHCFKRMQMKLLYAQSNIDQIVKRENFETFDLNIFDNRQPIDAAGGMTNREYMKQLKEYLQGWVERFDQAHGNLIFMGSPGVGKTFLTNCVAKALMDRYHSVVYLTSTDLFDSFSRSNYQDEAEQRDMSDAVMNCDLLIIDDLGTELTNSFTTSKLFYVINQRLVFRKSVVISTNLTFKNLRDNYSDRIVSRIMSDYEIIPLYGKDQRL